MALFVERTLDLQPSVKGQEKADLVLYNSKQIYTSEEREDSLNTPTHLYGALASW